MRKCDRKKNRKYNGNVTEDRVENAIEKLTDMCFIYMWLCTRHIPNIN